MTVVEVSAIVVVFVCTHYSMFFSAVVLSLGVISGFYRHFIAVGFLCVILCIFS